jgi:hypothetical protein
VKVGDKVRISEVGNTIWGTDIVGSCLAVSEEGVIIRTPVGDEDIFYRIDFANAKDWPMAPEEIELIEEGK